ncbi:MAG: hypothetical protein AAB557_02280 [Patescibacteria group bacterium]
MKKDNTIYLDDMLEAIKKIRDLPELKKELTALRTLVENQRR